MLGSKVCPSHGARAPLVREAAQRRLEAMVMPALSTLRVTMLRGESDAVRLKAAVEILDRVGIVAQQQLAVDNQITVRVTYEDLQEAAEIAGRDITTIVEMPALSETNGHTNGADV